MLSLLSPSKEEKEGPDKTKHPSTVAPVFNATRKEGGRKPCALGLSPAWCLPTKREVTRVLLGGK